MSAGEHEQVEGAPGTGIGHEHRDVRPQSIAIAAAGLAITTALTLILMMWLLGYFASRESRESAAGSPLAGAYGRQVPPEPRLQTAPLRDLAALRAAENGVLDTYGWVDREAGIARIPVERAMALLAERAAVERRADGEGRTP
jgi:hypothetical protein